MLVKLVKLELFGGPTGSRTPDSSMPWTRVTTILWAPLLKFSRIIFYCKALGIICLLNLQNIQPVQSEIRPKRSTKPEKT